MPYEREMWIVNMDYLKKNATQASGVGTANANAGIDPGIAGADAGQYERRSARFDPDNPQCIRLCGDGEEVDVSIVNISNGKAAVAFAGPLHFKNGTAAVLAIGQRIVGATRVIATGGTAQWGYVKTLDDPSGSGNIDGDALAADHLGKGKVIDGGTLPVANTDSNSDVVVLF